MNRKDQRTTLDMKGVLDHEIQVGELNVQLKRRQRDMNRGEEEGMRHNGDMRLLIVSHGRRRQPSEESKEKRRTRSE